MKALAEKKQSEETTKIVAGASQVLVSIFSALGTFLTIVDWPQERKIILALVLTTLWLVLKFALWNRKPGRTGRQRIPWLLNLFAEVQKQSKAWSRWILLKALFFRIIDLALLATILTIVLATALSSVEGRLRTVINPSTLTPTLTKTLTATLTLTLPPTSTATLTPSATTAPPASAFDYYMIVLDASAAMQESFDGQRKWDAAAESISIILAGLSPNSHYGLVVVGGTNPSGPSDLCGKPSSPTLDFSSLEKVEAQIGELALLGGGSFFNGYVLAKRRLEDLPVNTVKTLIYITGASDACETRDEWSDLKKILALPNQVGLYSEIIILDEDGLKSRTIAEQINSLSESINVQVAQTNQELREIASTNVVDNVAEYVSREIEIISGDATVGPVNVPPTRTSTVTAAPTITNSSPAPTAAIPTTASTPTQVILVNTPTPIPPTPVPPTNTASQTTVVCQSNRPGLSGPAYGGAVRITSPANCSTDHDPGVQTNTAGTYAGIPQGTVIWVFVYPPNGPYYPQSPNACDGPLSPPPDQSGVNWEVPSYLGTLNDHLKWFDIVVVLADQDASNTIRQRLYEDCQNQSYDGITAAELSQMNITEKESITVRTK